MATTMARRLTFLAFFTASLAGCGERHDSELHGARPPAPAAAASPAAATSPAAPPHSEPTPMAAPPASPPAAVPAAPAAGASAAVSKSSKSSKGEKGQGNGPAELKVKRLVLAEGVKGREPVAPGTTFHAPETERLYAFLEIENRSDVEGKVMVAFVPPDGGAPVGNVTLDVGVSPRWRTWAFTRGARKAGQWTAVVRSETGEELARAEFEVTL